MPTLDQHLFEAFSRRYEPPYAVIEGFVKNGPPRLRDIRDHSFFVMPPVPGSNAAYWLLEQLQRHELEDTVRVRLDPWLHGPAADLRGSFYRAMVWAKPLDWDRI